MNKYLGEEFLNKIYKDLVNSEIVKHTGNGGNKNEDIRIYMERLERITRRSLEHDNLRHLKQAYYDKYVIKPENVPDAYFAQLEQIALDNGHGHVQYTEKKRKEEIEHIISEQKESLDSWIDYFASSDTEMYPTWFKYFCFQGMIKLGYYDKEQDRYTKRTESTVKPFIEINREALAMVYDELVKVLNREEIDDSELEGLLKNGSFSKIYAYCIKKLDSIKKSRSHSDDGIWKKYLKGSDPNVLFNDIYGKGTGWCTAGGLKTATKHIEGGDFYVYYTKDEFGEFTCPRIAIRMERGKIAEIRGVAEEQNLESDMEIVVEKKLDEFPDKEEYKQKVENMKLLTSIYKKWKRNNNLELSIEEINFLYEVHDKIIGFGFKKDPRIKEIIDTRNIKKDLSFVFGCREEQLSLTSDEALGEDIICHYGNLEFDNLSSIENVTIPRVLNGSIVFKNLTSAKNVRFPETLNGNVELKELTSAEGLVLPRKMDENVYLNNLTNVEGLELPTEMGGTLYLNSITSAKGLKLPRIVGRTLNLNSLTSPEGLELPEIIGYSLHLRKLTNADGIKFPQIKRNLELNSVISAEGAEFPETLEGDLFLNSLKSGEGLKLPKTIGQTLNLSGLTNAKGIKFPEKVGSFLYLNSLENASGVELPKEIGGTLYLESLTSLEGIKFPETIGGLLLSDSLVTAQNAVLPKKIGKSLYFNKVTTASCIKFPETVGDDLSLFSLRSGKDLELPKEIGGTLDLYHLTSVEGLIIPDSLNCKLNCPLANNDINVLKQMCRESALSEGQPRKK